MVIVLTGLVTACSLGADGPPAFSIAPTAQTAVPSGVPSVAFDLPAAEAYLLAGIRPDAAIDCAPRREDPPARALAGVECVGSHPGVERVGFYLFATESDLLATYFERLEASRLELDNGGCFGGVVGDTNYVPAPVDLEEPHRHACFLNDVGVANYRATVPESRVWIAVLGTSRDTDALRKWAWQGNLDQPGGPTLWQDAR